MKTVSLALLAVVAALSAATVSPQTVERWQKAAVQKHPSVAQAGSALNQRFLAIVAEKRKSEPTYFDQPDWPLRAADAAAEQLRAEELVAKEKARVAELAAKEKAVADELAAKKKNGAGMRQAAVERFHAEDVAQWEREWEGEKARWVFDRLVFGDSEEVIERKLNRSKFVTPRVAATARVALNSRYRWILGESKFDIDFEMKDGLAAITFECLPERMTELDTLIREDWGKLRAAAIEQFGPPTKSAEYPTTVKLRRGGVTVTDLWERPGRPVALGINHDSGKCNAILRISDPARGMSVPAF